MHRGSIVIPHLLRLEVLVIDTLGLWPNSVISHTEGSKTGRGKSVEVKLLHTA
jgi:hypothetical protein